MSFELTERQAHALRLLGHPDVRSFLLYGGSRSAKTFLHCRTVATRAIAAPASRHAIFRMRFNHVKASIVLDTWPKMMRLCFPRVPYQLDKSDWYAELPNGSQVWFAGLDEKDRTEKVLGQEYATILLNEISQIPWHSRNMALTRLAQKCTYRVGKVDHLLRLLELADCNPPSKAHWSYRLYIKKQDVDTRQQLSDPQRYAALQMNPIHNLANIAPEYLETLKRLPARMRVRFLDGQYDEGIDNALWTLESIERVRVDDVPDLQRIVVAIDPSGASDDTDENEATREIGIMVGGLGVDGRGYLLEDLSLVAGPERWGNVAVNAYDRHDADLVVGETNFGGDMVRAVVHAAAAKPDRKGKLKPTFKKVTASRGKVVRAEPVSVLTEQDKVRFVGSFPQLEEELCAMTTNGYTGSGSPNRADAFVWLMSELFPGIVKQQKSRDDKPKDKSGHGMPQGAGGWMVG